MRLERERLAAETASAEASGTSSAVASDDDSVFGDKKRQKTKTKATSEPVPKVAGEPTEPTIIKDDKEDSKATVADLPNVSQLPEPGKALEK